MVDDATRTDDGFDPDESDLDEDGEDAEGRRVIVLNPAQERVTGRRVFAITAVLGGAVLVGAVIYGFITLYGSNGPSKGLEGVVLLVAGFVTVGLLLYLGTLVLRALDMGAPAEALGMPEGSIQALIAMSLILIFAIIGIQVFAAGSTGVVSMSTGLTQAQIDALRADGAIVVSQTLQTPVPAGAAPLYDITTRTVMTQEAHDFGLQLLTTVSTLVVAVAGFYFGSRATTQATSTVTEQLQATRAYSRRGVIGTQPEPNVATSEAPGEVVEDELATKEAEEDVDEEPALDGTENAEPGEGATGESGDGGEDGEDGEEPVEQPPQPPV